MDTGPSGVVEASTRRVAPRNRQPVILETEMNDLDLKDRLSAIESRAPSFEPPPVVVRRPRHFGLSLVSAAVLVLAVAATAVAGAVVVGGMVRGYPGVENQGQPLAGANLECMAPPQADAYLAAHGFTNVIWQVETGTTESGQGTTTFVTVPPAHGYIVPGAIVDGQLHMIVDQRAGASGTGACFGMPMP